MVMSKKFNWCLDWLIIGFILQNIFLWISVLSKQFDINWYLLLSIPFIFWGMELMQKIYGAY